MSGEPHEEPNGTPDSTPERLPPSERRESGLTAIQEAKLLGQCLKSKEWKKQRWPTRATPAELEEIREERPLNFLELGMQSVGKDLTDQDRRVRRIALKNLIAMEKQNQADEHKENEQKQTTAAPINLVRVVLDSREAVAAHEAKRIEQQGQTVEMKPIPEEETEDVD